MSSDRPISRLLDYYQYAAALAGTHLAREFRPGPQPVTLLTAGQPHMFAHRTWMTEQSAGYV